MIKLTKQQSDFIQRKESVIALRNNDIEKFLISATEKDRPVFAQFLMECGVNIFQYMKKIPEGCFAGSDFLTGLDIPSQVEEIGSDAFKGCQSLKSVTIDNSVMLIGNDAFENCFSLESVNLPDKLGRIPSNCFKNCTSLKEIFIPDSVSTIGSNAFEGCDNIVIKFNRRDSSNQLRISKADVEFLKKHIKYKKQKVEN